MVSKTKITILIFVLIYLISITENKFVSTSKSYNGAIGYSGLFEACSKEFSTSKPCDSINLIQSFWKYTIPASWYLTTSLNCLGYSTNDSYVAGQCIASLPGNFTYATTCTCEMRIPICCYMNN